MEQEIKDIWLPHIPKNAGTTIIDSLKLHTKNNKYFNWWRSEDGDFVHITNKKTQKQIKANHVNPLEKGMEDWLKILIIRNPVDRFLSRFNYFQWEKYYLKKELDIPILDNGGPHNPEWWVDFAEMHCITHLQWLTNIQSQSHNPVVILVDGQRVHEFTIKNVFDIFDYIIDVSNIQKVFTLIEDNFLQKKIKWPSANSSEENFAAMTELPNVVPSKILLKKDLTEEQLKTIYQLEYIQKELEFYNLATERI